MVTLPGGAEAHASYGAVGLASLLRNELEWNAGTIS
jgi:hypothetical protein